MKKIIGFIFASVVLFAFLFSLCGISATASEEYQAVSPSSETDSQVAAVSTVYSGTCGENLNWSLDTNTGEMRITGIGEMDYSHISWGSYYADIKSVVIEDGVTSICDYAFGNSSYIKNVYLPASIKSIGYQAFYSSSSIDFTFCGTPKRWNAVKRDDHWATEYGNYNNIHVTIDYYHNYTANGRCAICNSNASGECGLNLTWEFNSYTETLTISGTGEMTDFGSYYNPAPWNSYNIIDVVVESGVTSIGENAFYGKQSISSVTMSEGLTEICDYAFYNCTKLKSITIPASITSIAYNAFLGCKLDKINIKDLAAWCNISGGMLEYSYHSNHLYLNDELITDLVIPDGVTKIGDYAFYKCHDITSVTIPYSVTSVGYEAFYNCHLTSLDLGEGLKTIGYGAFRYCTLTSIVIPDSVTSIDENAFSDSNFISIKVGKGLTEVVDWAFNNCTGLKDIYYSGDESDREKISIGSYNTYFNCATWHYNVCTDISTKHTYEWVIDQEKDCFTDGIKHEECSVCHIIRNENTIIQAVGHSYSSVVAIPTCTTNGYTTHTCLSCNHSYTDTETTKLGHDMSSATCTEASECKRTGCNHTEGTALGHDTLNNICQREGCDYIGGTCGENLTWTLDDKGTLTISGHGEMSGFTTTSTAPWYSFNASISNVVISSGVTNIGYLAFYNCASITRITLPDSVESIDRNAFYGCIGLKAVYITDLGKWCEIKFGNSTSNPLHYACSLYENNELLTDLVIPEGVTSIGSYAFYGYTSLTSITILNGITSIESFAFSGCTSLTSITIPDSVTSIEIYAFSGCTSLTSITIPNGVTCIESYAFEGCTSLKGITIPNGIKTICDSTFYGCSALVDVTIPNGVTSIESHAFEGCSSLSSITLPSGITSIGDCAFSECRSLVSVTLPYSVTSIGDSAFRYCFALTTIILPDGITKIGDWLFFGCTSLTSVSMPESITNIGNYAFSCCDSLKNIVIPYGITKIDSSAFSGCSNLNNIIYCGNIEERNNISIGENNSEFIDATWTYDCCIKSNSGKHEYDNVCDTTCNCCEYTRVAPHSFEWIVDQESTCEVNGIKHQKCILCNVVVNENITIPALGHDISSATCTEASKCKRTDCNYIERSALGHSFTDYIFNNDATCIVDGTKTAKCDRCNETNTVIALNSNLGHSYSNVVTKPTCTIGGYTTHTCSRCNDSYTDTETTKLGHDMLNNICQREDCDYIGGTCGENLTWTLDAEGTLAISGYGEMFDYTYDIASSISTAPWNGVLNCIIKVTNSNNITKLGDYAFYGCNNLTSITLPEDLTIIGDSAFQNCNSLKNITIPEGVMSIGSGAFSGCSSLVSIVIPDGVKNIDSWTFNGCTSLTSITMPSSIAIVGDYAFQSCSSLTSITIPDDITTIGHYAFRGCSSIQSLIVSDSVTKIHIGAFVGCSSLTNIIIPNGITSIENFTFSGCSGLISVRMLGNVTSIGVDAFYGCNNLTSIVIPNSVREIDDSAFDRCSKLDNVLYGGSVEDRNNISIGSDNDCLNSATWSYNCCIKTASGEHEYDNACDETCSLCGYVRIAPHNFEWVIDKESICTAEGSKHQKCAFCNAVTDENTAIPALGHDMSSATCTEASKCKRNGCNHTEGTALGHKYSSVVIAPTCTTGGYTTHTCSRCNHSYTDTETAALGHSWTNATCTTAKTCTTCGAIEGSALGHNYSSVVTAPTCTTGGYITHACSRCNDTYTDTETPKLGHDMSSATCTEASKCKRNGCNHTEGSALGHNYNNVVTAPTCTTGGYTTHTCSRCNDTYRDAETTKLGHDMSSATCTEASKCKRSGCNHTEGTALGHNYGSVVTAPTCTTGGYTTHTCSRCNDTYRDAETTKLGHDMSSATCTEISKCQRTGCTHTVGSAPGHNFANDATCDICGYVRFYVIYDSNGGINTPENMWVEADSIKISSQTPHKSGYVFVGWRILNGGDTVYQAGSTVSITGDMSLWAIWKKNCSHCNGEGTETFTGTCSSCFGTGRVNKHSYCSYCLGTGDAIAGQCAYCSGTGSLKEVCSSCKGFGGTVRCSCVCGNVWSPNITGSRICSNCGRLVNAERMATCTWCSGSGLRDKTCSMCSGTGKMWRDCSYCYGTGSKYVETNCETCSGTGTAITVRACSICDGKKYAPDCETHTYGPWIELDTIYHCQTCSVCGNTQYKEHAYTRQVISNTYKKTDADCDSRAVYYYCCEICDAKGTESFEYGDILGHTGGTATCIAQAICTHCDQPYGDTLDHDMNAATCTAPKTCSACGATEGSALGHNFTTYTSDNNATCISDGTKTSTCTRCTGTDTVTDVNSKLGHNMSSATCTEASKCKRVGCNHTEGSSLGHGYNNVVTAPTCTTGGYTTHTCSRCNHSYTDAETSSLGHTWANATCTTAKTCSVCGATEGDVLGHSYNSVVTAPTCTTGGYTTHTCSRCNHSYTDSEVSALGHSFTNYISNGDATCTADGTKSAACERCNENDTMLDANSKLEHTYSTTVTAPTCTDLGYTTYICHCGDSYDGDYINPTGHRYDDDNDASCNECSFVRDINCKHSNKGAVGESKAATCTESGITAGVKCLDCGEIIEAQQIQEKLSHKYSSSITYPTCSTGGYTTHTCSRCNHSYTDSETLALGHTWVNATCTTAKTCSVCGATEGYALGHSYSSVVTAPACTIGGYTAHTCSRCNHSYRDSETLALGHSWNNGVIEKEPTIDEAGTKLYTCTVCSTTKTEDIPKLSGIAGDVDGNAEVTSSDAVYLLMHTFYPEDYPVEQESDFNGDGNVNSSDAIYLLMYTFYPEDYPLMHSSQTPAILSSRKKEDE